MTSSFVRTKDGVKKITLPVLVRHGDDDQIAPYADSGVLSARLLPHGMPTTHADVVKGCRAVVHRPGGA